MVGFGLVLKSFSASRGIVDPANLPSQARWFCESGCGLRNIGNGAGWYEPSHCGGLFYLADLFQLAVPRQVSKQLKKDCDSCCRGFELHQPPHINQQLSLASQERVLFVLAFTDFLQTEVHCSEP
jgi:hypothetical protein